MIAPVGWQGTASRQIGTTTTAATNPVLGRALVGNVGVTTDRARQACSCLSGLPIGCRRRRSLRVELGGCNSRSGCKTTTLIKVNTEPLTTNQLRCNDAPPTPTYERRPVPSRRRHPVNDRLDEGW